MMIEYILRRAQAAMSNPACWALRAEPRILLPFKQLVTPHWKNCATMRHRIPARRTTMKKTPCVAMCARLPAAAAQPDVEALKLNPQNKLYRNEQADWCVGIKLDGGFEDNGPFASSRSLRADYRIWDLPDIPNFSNFTVWPHLIRLSEERALVGVIGPAAPDYKQEIQFSGGSSRKDLYLFMVDLDQKVSGRCT